MSVVSEDVDCPIDVNEIELTDLLRSPMYPLMSIDVHVVAVLDGDGSFLECMMLVFNVDVAETDVPMIVFSDCNVVCSCHLMMCIM